MIYTKELNTTAADEVSAQARQPIGGLVTDSAHPEKRIDLNRSVYELTEEYPELIGILGDIGFTDITKPGMLQSAGRFMTIPKGAKLKRFDLEDIRAALAQRGFTTI